MVTCKVNKVSDSPQGSGAWLKKGARLCLLFFPMELSTTLLPRLTPEANAKFTKQQVPQSTLTVEIFCCCYTCLSHISSFLRLRKDVESCLHQDLCASFLISVFYSSTDVLLFFFTPKVCLSKSLELSSLGLEHYLLVHRQALPSDFTQNRTTQHPTCL